METLKTKLLLAALFSSIYCARGKGDLKDLYNCKNLLNRDLCVKRAMFGSEGWFKLIRGEYMGIHKYIMSYEHVDVEAFTRYLTACR